MNQILSEEMPQAGKKKKRTKANIHSILIVFSVILMIFGIGTVSTGAYSLYKNKQKNSNSGLPISANTKPAIAVERTDSDNIKIVVEHDKEIEKVTYQLNEEDEVTIQGEGRKKIQEEIKLEPGKTVISIIAKDINGISGSFNDEYDVKQKPQIKLEAIEGNKIKVTIKSKIALDTIAYYWDDDEANKKEEKDNNMEKEFLVDVLEGTHTLIVTAKDIDGNDAKESQKIIGDKKPTLNVGTDGNSFLIEAEDDEELSKIEIKLNTNEVETIEIHDKKFEKEIPLVNGVNKLTVKVYNKNELSETSKVKFTKE